MAIWLIRMHGAPITFAASRQSTIPNIGEYATMSAAWSRTQQTLGRMQELLRDSGLVTDLFTVAASGSLGRMEQLAPSDADLIVVLQGNPSPEVMQAAVREVRRGIAPLALPMPESGGIFDVAITLDQLIGVKEVGRIDESPSIFGKRIQLLLDAQPVFHAPHFEQLQADIVARYLFEADHERADAWTYLLDDLIRYFRCLSINSKWKHRGNPKRWEDVKIKFGHSRRLLYAGLLLLLGESTVERSRPTKEWLLRHLKLTPLERVADVYGSRGDANFSRVCGWYEQFLAGMAHPNSERSDLHANAEAFAAELSRFTFRSAQHWAPDFANRLLF